MAAAATEDNEIIPRNGGHFTSEIWKWFDFARSDAEQAHQQFVRTSSEPEKAAHPTCSHHTKQKHAVWNGNHVCLFEILTSARPNSKTTA